MAFQSHRGRIPICSSIVARNMATLLMADLHPVGGPDIWYGIQISTSISSRIHVHLDEDGCPMEVQPFPHATFLLRKLPPLWENGSITGSEFSVAAQPAAHIFWRNGNYNGKTLP